MSAFWSHFQITPKNAVVYLVAFAAYVQSLGHLPETARQWEIAAVGFLLSTLAPSRGVRSGGAEDEAKMGNREKDGS